MPLSKPSKHPKHPTHPEHHEHHDRHSHHHDRSSLSHPSMKHDHHKKEPRITGRNKAALGLGILLFVLSVLAGFNIFNFREIAHTVLPFSVPGWTPILVGFFGLVLIATFLMRKFVSSSKTWTIISMWETERFNSAFDGFKNAKWSEWLTEIGAVLGFGAVAVDYFWGRKLKSKWQRILLFILAILILSQVLGIFFGNFATNPLAKGPAYIYQFLFGLFGFSGFLFAALFFQGIDGLFKIFEGQQACPGIAPIIPGVQTPNVPIFVPIEAWISLLALLVVHEASHAILMRRHNLKILGSGVLLLGFLPIGAFVRPNEEKIAKLEKKKQIHILSAGPSSNLYSYFAIVFFSILAGQFIFAPFIAPTVIEYQKNSSLGVEITNIDQNFVLCGEAFPSPAYGVIPPGSKILAIDDKNILTTQDALTAITQNNPGEPKKFLLQKDGQIFEKTLTPNALGKVGIQLATIPNPAYTPSDSLILQLQLLGLFSSIVLWFGVLSLLVAIANFMPIEPLDGGKIAKYMVTPYFGFLQMTEEDTERFVGRLFLWILIPLIILNALPIFL